MKSRRKLKDFSRLESPPPSPRRTESPISKSRKGGVRRSLSRTFSEEFNPRASSPDITINNDNKTVVRVEVETEKKKRTKEGFNALPDVISERIEEVEEKEVKKSEEEVKMDSQQEENLEEEEEEDSPLKSSEDGKTCTIQ